MEHMMVRRSSCYNVFTLSFQLFFLLQLQCQHLLKIPIQIPTKSFGREVWWLPYYDCARRFKKKDVDKKKSVIASNVRDYLMLIDSSSVYRSWPRRAEYVKEDSMDLGLRKTGHMMPNDALMRTGAHLPIILPTIMSNQQLIVFDFDWYEFNDSNCHNRLKNFLLICSSGQWLIRILTDGFLKFLLLISAKKWRTSRLREDLNGLTLCKKESAVMIITFPWPLFLPSRAQSLREAHARGITKEQIIHALQIMPFVCGL